MAGTKIGGLKAAKKNLEKNPDFYKQMGKAGGSAKVPKGFSAMDKKRLSEISRKGGSNSKRGKKDTK